MRRMFKKDDEGVSPVVAVIILVAITVVLAGVLYIWVSNTMQAGGLGKETAPTMIFQVKNHSDALNDTWTKDSDTLGVGDQVATIRLVEGKVLFSEITVMISADGDQYTKITSEAETETTPIGDSQYWETGEAFIVSEGIDCTGSEDVNYLLDSNKNWKSTDFYVRVIYDPTDKVVYDDHIIVEESTHNPEDSES